MGYFHQVIVNYIGKLNFKEIGRYLGSFIPDDLILALYNDGNYELTNSDPLNHYDIDKLLHIEQFVPERVISAVYFNAENGHFFVKRFNVETTTTGKMFRFINENEKSYLALVSTGTRTIIKFDYIEKKTGEKKNEVLELSEFVDVMGWKAVGKKLAYQKISNIKIVDVIYEEDNNGEENEEALSEEDMDIIISDDDTVDSEDVIKESTVEKAKVSTTEPEENLIEEITEPEPEITSEINETVEKKSKKVSGKKDKAPRQKQIIIPEVNEFTEEKSNETVSEEFKEIEFGLNKSKKEKVKKQASKDKGRPEETQLSLF